MTGWTLTECDPSDLQNHLVNIDIYGTQDLNPDLVESIKANGVMEPIRCTKDKIVLSGHRRRQHAIAAKIKTVPVLIARGDIGPEEQILHLIEANRQREKTTEQKAREYSKLAEVKAKLAEKREKSGKGIDGSGGRGKQKNPTENFTEGLGEAKEQAAKEVGMSRPTAEKAAEVVKVIDEAEEQGDTETAEKLREALNKGSVSAAHREAKKVREPKAESKPEAVKDALKKPVCVGLSSVFEEAPKFRGLQNELGAIVTDIEALSAGAAGGRIDLQECQRLAEQLRVQLKFAAPHTECPKCRRDWKRTCNHCKGSGWLTRSEFNACATDADKAWLESRK